MTPSHHRLTVWTLAAMWSGAAAAAPLVVPQSGLLLDAQDRPVDGTVSLRFSVFDAAGGGASLWDSGASGCPVTVRQGRYAATLGDSCGSGLTDAAWPPGATRFLEVAVGGVPLSPRLPLTPVPVAQLALGLPAGAVTNAMLQRSTVEVTAGTGLTGGGTVSLGGSTRLDLAPSGVTPGTYTNASVTVDTQGRVTAASNGTLPVTDVTAGTGLSASNSGGNVSVSLAPSGVVAGTYSNASVTVDAQGRVTAVAAGAGLNSSSVGNVELKSDAASLARVSAGALSTDGAAVSVGGAAGGTLVVKGAGEWPVRLSYDSTYDSNRTHVLTQRSRNNGAVTSGDTLGGLAMGGRFGTGVNDWTQGWNGGAEVTGFATENWSATARGTALGFLTAANGGVSTTEKMRLTGDGRLGIGTGSPLATLDVRGGARFDTAGTNIADRMRQGTKTIAINVTDYTQVLAVDVGGVHNSALVRVFFGGWDWCGHSALSYRAEYIVKRGDGGYGEPGTTLSETSWIPGNSDTIVSRLRRIAGTNKIAIDLKVSGTGGCGGTTTPAEPFMWEVWGPANTVE